MKNVLNSVMVANAFPMMWNVMKILKKKRLKKMKRYRVAHKHAGTERVIAGRDFYDACRRCGCSTHFWKLVEELD